MQARRIVGVALLVAAGSVVAQDRDVDETTGAWSITVQPPKLHVEVGQSATLTATVHDERGEPVDDATVMFYSRARRSVGVTKTGVVTAHQPGEFTVVVLVPRDPDDTRRRGDARARVEVPVTVPQQPVVRLSFVDIPPKFYVGTRPELLVQVFDAGGAARDDVSAAYATGDPSVAEVDRFGRLTLHRPGTVELTARVGDVAESVTIDVDPNPVAGLELQASADQARTGDVVRFTAIAKDARGLSLRSIPVEFGVSGVTAPNIIAAGASAMVTPDGRFVAERSGIYRVVATSGTHSASRTVQVTPRDVQRGIELVGRGRVVDRHTSDLWVWEGADGRDYAITGTWGADGHSYVWDVTEPAQIERLREVRVDARTINDVKVSEDGEIAVISREGASDRKNGIVILGVSNPREGIPILAEFTDQLTGGVHNLFISEDHVFALSAGRWYDVINIEDPREPHRVGRFELETPGHAVHDVWVSDGVAFSSNWADGVVAVDIGGGGRGGTPTNPVELGRYAYPSGWNHAAFPYRSRSTGTFYLFAGDEAFPYGDLDRERKPTRTAGWIHIIDWSDWSNPREVARYQVPEAGSHNLWVDDDILYAAFYNGGLRVVDVSGELLGDLYRQGREIATFLSYDPDGVIPNAPFVWGPQPHKGHIFFTDWNSGLWAVRLLPRQGPARIIGEPQ